MKPLSSLLMATLLSLSTGLCPVIGLLLLLLLPASAEPWTAGDPAPPKVTPVPADLASAPASPTPFDRLTFLAKPAPLAKDAVTSEWPRFLGPTDDAHSPETHLLADFSKGVPKLLWQVQKGDSYSTPAIQGDRLLLFHHLDKKETLECLHPETGQRYWVRDYPITYRDRYGFANGPRASPVIADGCVITLGVTSVLTCYDLATGHQLWQRDLRSEFHVPHDFFGQGSSPLVIGGKIIVNVGGKATEAPIDDSAARYEALAQPGLSVGAFDLRSGKLLWGVQDAWGASYASPVAATIHGRQVVLLYAGGEGSPAIGGLMCIDPTDGTLLDRFPWRADEYIQATGSSPVVIPGKNRVFISTAYPKRHPLGGVMVEYDQNFKARSLWQSSQFSTHWMTPIHVDGYIYGIDGETENQAQLVCFDAENGKEQWRQEVTWQDTELNGGRPAQLGIQRASLLHLDGESDDHGHGKTLCLGELGTLLWLDLSPKGCQVLSHSQLFYAPHSWCLPALRHGLLYVMQNYEEQVRGKTGQRMMCLDLRGE